MPREVIRETVWRVTGWRAAVLGVVIFGPTMVLPWSVGWVTIIRWLT